MFQSQRNGFIFSEFSHVCQQFRRKWTLLHKNPSHSVSVKTFLQNYLAVIGDCLNDVQLFHPTTATNLKIEELDNPKILCGRMVFRSRKSMICESARDLQHPKYVRPRAHFQVISKNLWDMNFITNFMQFIKFHARMSQKHRWHCHVSKSHHNFITFFAPKIVWFFCHLWSTR